MNSSSPPPPQKTLKNGRYVLGRVLGEGTQGETYEAEDTEKERTTVRPRPEALVEDWNRYVERVRSGSVRPSPTAVAIKCFRVAKAREWKDVELAEREATTLASLSHPKLPRYLEHFEEDGALYLVMERIDGESLARRKGRGSLLGEADVVRMLEDIGDALRYLHGRAPAVVHRDVKPGNIIRRPDGSYALVDFGSVRDRLKPAGGSTVVGTFGFMAPEQFQGRASGQSDVYGLGVTAITMLTGTEPEDLPHEGLGIDVARSLPRSVSPDLVRALTKMVEPDPTRRAASIDEALALLRRSRPPSRPPSRHPERQPESSRPPHHHSRREERKAAQRAKRAERRHARALARERAAPFVPRVLAHLGLFVAWLVVWLTVGFAVPLVLVLLSVLFGGRLWRAAGACVRAARRSQAALGRASARLSGRTDPPAVSTPNVRVAPFDPAVRVQMPLDDEAAAEEHAGALDIDDPPKAGRRVRS